MKTQNIAGRVDFLSEKLRDPTSGSFVHLDFNSFSEAEKQLFRKVDEVAEEFQKTGNEQLLLQNADLIIKNLEVLFNRVTDLYCYVVPQAIGCGTNQELIEYFFKQHFLNFEKDLAECMANLSRWSEKDREEFLCDLKKHGPLYYRIPRGFSQL